MSPGDAMALSHISRVALTVVGNVGDRDAGEKLGAGVMMALEGPLHTHAVTSAADDVDANTRNAIVRLVGALGMASSVVPLRQRDVSVLLGALLQAAHGSMTETLFAAVVSGLYTTLKQRERTVMQCLGTFMHVTTRCMDRCVLRGASAGETPLSQPAMSWMSRVLELLALVSVS
jgi:hypothetical protein